jgi:hypothetical protein
MSTTANDNDNTSFVNHLQALKQAVSSLHRVYLAGRERDFLSLLERLGADERMQAGALELVRYFNPKKGRFKIPRHKVMEMLGKSLLLGLEIEEAIESFKAGRKNPSGGLKRFHKQFKEEYEERADTLREYRFLKEQREKLEDEKMQLFKNLKDAIPEDIEAKIGKRGVKTLAADWMLKYLPCKKSTLLQIIRYKPERSRVMKKSNKKHRG